MTDEVLDFIFLALLLTLYAAGAKSKGTHLPHFSIKYGPSLASSRSTTNSYSALCTKSMIFFDATVVTNKKNAAR